jgi:hypothetical protein
MLLRGTIFRIKVVENIKHTFYVQNMFSKNRAVDQIMWKMQGTARKAADGTTLRRMYLAR